MTEEKYRCHSFTLKKANYERDQKFLRKKGDLIVADQDDQPNGTDLVAEVGKYVKIEADSNIVRLYPWHQVVEIEPIAESEE